MFWNRHKKTNDRYFALAVLFFLSFATTACHPSDPIIEWESNHFNRVVEISGTGAFIPFCHRDSAQLMMAEYEWLKQQKVRQLQQQIDTAKRHYEQALIESESISNPTLKKLFLNQVLVMQKKLAAQESILALYTDSTAYTQLTVLKQRASHYMINPQEGIGFSRTVELVVKTGSLPATKVSRRYLYTASKKQIIGELSN